MNTALRVPGVRLSALAAMVVNASPLPEADNTTRATRMATKPSWVMIA
jgi:hypothetical protein